MHDFSKCKINFKNVFYESYFYYLRKSFKQCLKIANATSPNTLNNQRKQDKCFVNFCTCDFADRETNSMRPRWEKG